MKCVLVNDNFYSDYVTNLIRARGGDPDKILSPDSSALSDPTQLEYIKEAADLYLKAINGTGVNRLALVVDSDNDGFTSAAIFYQYTQKIAPGIIIDYYIHEGKQHGLEDVHEKILNSKHQYDLVVLPDSSTNDYEYHEMLRPVAKCLVLDHHEASPGIQFSTNAIIVNNQLSIRYPNKQLTGAGVVYQFCRYIDRILNVSYANDYIDLAAMGIIGDMGSVMEPENAYIIREGLKEKNIKNTFFRVLLEKQAYSITGQVGCSFGDLCKKLTPISIAFYIVPLINATIRVGSLSSKRKLVHAFLNGNDLIESEKRGHKGELDTVANEAARECGNNRDKQNKIRDEVCDEFDMRIAKYDLLENSILFIRLDDDDDFPSELNGLIAMRIADKYKRPAIVARLNDEGFVRGSARGLSQSEFSDFRQFLIDSGLVEYAEGHPLAFGVSLPNANLSKLHSFANKALSKYNFNETYYSINFDRDGNAPDLPALINEISSSTKIWGQQNDEPLIRIKLTGVNRKDIQIMGKLSDTVKIMYNGVSYMFFKCSKRLDEFEQFEKMDIELVGTANINVWGGRATPQIFVKDFELNDNLLSF